jgi:hypothetical protein
MTLDFVFKMCTGQLPAYWLDRGALDWYDRYANPRNDAGKGVLVANWNEFPRPSNKEFNWSTKGRKFQAILKSMGFHLEWMDQTSRCDHCYGAITEGPDYYGDTAHYAILKKCEFVCADCIRKDFVEEYLEGLENNPRTACHISGINPSQYGYTMIRDEYENGFHPGQTDNPKTIFNSLHERGFKRILFKIDGSGQFDVRFSVWYKSDVDEDESVGE